MEINELKQRQRKELLNIRNNLNLDYIKYSSAKIFDKIKDNSFFTNDNILVYISIKSEVSTLDIINYYLAYKKISVPFCIPKTHKMDFYYINSLSDLQNGAYNIPEPNINKCKKNVYLDNGICLVPGVAFDKNGYRMGYGGGYYDRFLSQNPGLYRVGLTYERCLLDKIICDEHDVTMNCIITEKNTYYFNRE